MGRQLNQRPFGVGGSIEMTPIVIPKREICSVESVFLYYFARHQCLDNWRGGLDLSPYHTYTSYGYDKYYYNNHSCPYLFYDF